MNLQHNNRFMLKLMYKLSRDEENVDKYRLERVLLRH